MITHERLTSVLSYDALSGKFTWKECLAPRGRIGTEAGFNDPLRNRISIRIDGKLYLAHRLAWFYVHKEWPDVIDHADGNPSNNSISNLRVATVAQNMWNSRKKSQNTSGVKGVSFNRDRNKWVAQLRANGELILCKRFSSFEEAKAAYELAALKFHGEFARIG